MSSRLQEEEEDWGLWEGAPGAHHRRVRAREKVKPLTPASAFNWLCDPGQVSPSLSHPRLLTGVGPHSLQGLGLLQQVEGRAGEHVFTLRAHGLPERTQGIPTGRAWGTFHVPQEHLSPSPWGHVVPGAALMPASPVLSPWTKDGSGRGSPGL